MENRLLKSLRVREGLRQEDMAKMLGISGRAYTEKENGKSQWKVGEARKISKYFDISMEDLFFSPNVTSRVTIEEEEKCD